MEPRAVEEAAMGILMEDIRGTLDRYGVEFDQYFSERELHTPEYIGATYQLLREHDAVYERDGALWLRSSAYGDDKDRVLRRSDGSEGYLMADIAYFRHKRARAHERCIDILGADHHGHTQKMSAAICALGDDPTRFENPILQMVNLTEGGKVVKMGKRSGKFVTLGEVIDDIGVDTTRYFMLQRSGDSPISIDLDLARQESSENPVHYIKYAHARAHSILQAVPASPLRELPRLQPAEKRLIAECARWEEVVNRAGNERAPHMVASYALELSQSFTAFYHECRVADAPEAEQAFRRQLVSVARERIATALDLLGIQAPERMNTIPTP
jgi:arginyl-tRNA synthetase